jgi:choline dehydrogenase-like flavoprotein
VASRRYDVLIIGSGAGGGTIAQALAPLCQQGKKIAVLEWGPRYRPEDFTGNEVPMANQLYFDGGGFFTKDRTMTLAFAKAFGGSTVVYTGTSLRVDAAVVDGWQVLGLTGADLRARSERYLAENNVHLQPEELLNDNNHLFAKACRQLGWHVEQFPVNTKGCRGCSRCNLGCRHEAKQGTNIVQLPAAEAQGVEVIHNCKVRRIGEGEAFVTVEAAKVGVPSPWPPGDYHIEADTIVVAGGAIQSPALLMRSGLPVNLPALGRYLTMHPALITMGLHDRPITNFYGHPKSYYCEEFMHSDRALLETCMYFPFTTAKNIAAVGEDHATIMGAMDRMQQILVLALDKARPSNRVTIDAQGEPVVDYNLNDDIRRSLAAGMRASAQILFAAGATRVHAPAGPKAILLPEDQAHLDQWITAESLLPGRASITSAHLMGGCRMGDDPAVSVTDAWGQVHGLPWLFVADSSLFPDCARINPYVTVMALADRVAEKVTERVQQTVAV